MRPRDIATKAFDALSSYTLAGILFCLLLLITYLGTLEQIEHGLFATQQKYFSSFFVVHNFFGVAPAVLPGGYLLIALLSVNLLLGGFVRLRKKWSLAGVMITHVGVVILVAGAFITHHQSVEGHLTLYENEQSDAFLSYHDWEITLTDGSVESESAQYVIPSQAFNDLRPGHSTTFRADDLPFSLRIDRFAENASYRPSQGASVPGFIAESGGFALYELERETKNERNIAGVSLTLEDKQSGRSRQAILWGMQNRPEVFVAADTPWLIRLQRQRWKLPFTIVLDDFTRKLHPGTNMPSEFMSDIRKIEDGSEQPIHIAMNEPLRYKGYTFFQSSWGPQDAAPGDPLFSTFSVVRNPADHFPLYACIVITIGLVLHFSLKLSKHLRASRRLRA